MMVTLPYWAVFRNPYNNNEVEALNVSAFCDGGIDETGINQEIGMHCRTPKGQSVPNWYCLQAENEREAIRRASERSDMFRSRIKAKKAPDRVR